MDWPIDQTTQMAARKFVPIINAGAPSTQFGGRRCDPARWRNVLPPGEAFAARPRVFPDAPDMIISDFAAGHYLQALARTISWGAMWRTKNYIYRDHGFERVYHGLDCCARSIGQTRSIHQSWELLTGDPPGLQWSGVMTSKVLHFLCRALGFRQDPPVPIDGAVIRKQVWPVFRNAITEGGQRREMYPDNWEGNGFSAYCRYMTAIITWAEVKAWTTTEVETTIFAKYSPDRT